MVAGVHSKRHRCRRVRSAHGAGETRTRLGRAGLSDYPFLAGVSCRIDLRSLGPHGVGHVLGIVIKGLTEIPQRDVIFGGQDIYLVVALGIESGTELPDL